LGFGLYWAFGLFYLNEQLESLLVDLAHQLYFYLDSPVLTLLSKNLQIHYLLVDRRCKHKESLITIGMAN